MSAKALVVLAHGFEEVEAVTVIDVLRRGGVEVVTAALADDGPAVRGAHGMTLLADAPFAEASTDEYDAVVLPGGGEGTDNLRSSAALAERLKRQKEEGRLLCAICAAPLVLVDAGVLDDEQHVTCYPTCALDLDRPCAGVPVVADGAVITGQAPGSAMLFALVVLQALTDEKTARKIARGMVSDVLD
ncbi:MAG: DJ-1/PfpI family protein [Kiritimatiellae bacterium]|nr:DJ-1/PfpI family protein [Kiritimatiellia bacterium]